MIIRRSRRYTVKMQDYETYTFGADIEMSHHDIGMTDGELVNLDEDQYAELAESLTQQVLNALADQLTAEIESAAELTDHDKSFLLKAFDLAPTPRRRTRK